MPLARLLPVLAIAAAGALALDVIETGVSVGAAAPTGASGGSAPICGQSAAEIAAQAGMSPAELEALQSLKARRSALDAREEGLSTQLAVVQTAEAKVDSRIAELHAAQQALKDEVGQADARRQADVDRLARVFEAMPPAAAAARIAPLSDDVRLAIALRMRARSLAAVITAMPPPEAKRLAEAMANQGADRIEAARQTVTAGAAEGWPASGG